LSKEIVDATTNDEYHIHLFSSEDFVYEDRCNYNFSVRRLGEVHESNRKRVSDYARSCWSPIIVDIANMKVWEMKTYFEIAVRFGSSPHIGAEYHVVTVGWSPPI
jgi:hypothetical protein